MFLVNLEHLHLGRKNSDAENNVAQFHAASARVFQRHRVKSQWSAALNTHATLHLNLTVAAGLRLTTLSNACKVRSAFCK